MMLRRLAAALIVVISFAAVRAIAQESRGPVMPTFQGSSGSGSPTDAPPPPAATVQPDDGIELVGPTDSQKARAQAAAKAQADAEVAAKARAAADAEAKADAEARAKIEEEVRARVEAEAKARAEVEAKTRAAAEAKARAAAEAQAKADAQARAESEAKARAAAEAQARIDAKARAEADAKAREEAQRAAAVEAARQAEISQSVANLPAAAAEPAPLPVAAPAPSADEGNADLIAAPTRRVITPGALPPPPPAPIAPAPAPTYAAPTYAAPTYAAPVAAAPAYVPAPAPAPAEQSAYVPAAAPAPAAAAPSALNTPAYVPGVAPPAPSTTPGFVDVAAHMREQDAAAKQALLCKQAKRKHRKGKALADACSSPTTEMALPEAVASNRDELPLTPIDASSSRGVVIASPPPSAQPVVAQPAAQTVVLPSDERAPGTRVASAAPTSVIAPSYTQQLRPDPIDERPGQQSLAVPMDERGEHSRTFHVSDELLASPGPVTNALTLGGDLVPDSITAAFTYRYVGDDSGAAHHGFFFTAGGAPCDDAGSCSFRASGMLGFSPSGSNNFAAAGVAGQSSLAWSSIYAGANIKARTESGFGFDAGAQLQSLSMTYSPNIASPSVSGNANLGMLKLEAAGTYQTGAFEARFMFSGDAYLSGTTGQSNGAPLRGVFYDPELGGLASGPEGIFAKLEARYSFSFGLTAQLSYGYLSYAGPQWSNANVISARVAQQISKFQVGVGLTEQLDSPTNMPANASLMDYATLYFNGFVGMSF